ncbi:MAG: EamA family transporter RarD [Pseudomonadota bacterium]
MAAAKGTSPIPGQTTPAGETPSQDEAVRFGLIAGVMAYTFWGLFPIYLKMLSDVAVTEVLAHRILWSVPFGAIILSYRKQWPEVIRAVRQRKVILMLTISAIAISLNWLIYVWAVANDRVLEASLGYYINPLMYVAAGVLVLGEKLRPLQIGAVALATIGVLVLTFGVGSFPWVSITLAILFTAYGYVRKTTDVGAMPGLFVETSLLAPFALIFMIFLFSTGQNTFANTGSGMNVLLILAGPVTVGPLVLFALAARRLKLSTLGFLQYIGPTLQFFLGIYFGEAFTLAHGICFGLIWTALAVFSIDAVRQRKGA